uniref:Allergen Bra j 1-E n=1 Tax=Brassica juncea TaxID=3707 RepID=ALL1_BRAJU|nr:RecName: Full=Allergen Bra j 1-E; AltName: Full=Allergen Bra j I; AltName: Allergen=Bra j 1-E; Contains: RecName: Full=Allergen Bra j 1-E small chain; Contains: RecName: Full=Allergen Bra j 1-E large chain [Brassica juncea]
AGPFRFPRCRKEFQQAQHLRACQQWLHKQAMQSGSGPQPQGPQQRPPLLQQCCNELHQEEPLCVCPTLKGASKAVKQQIRQQGQQQGQQGQQLQHEISRIYQTATHLPRVCNIPRVSICPFQKTMPGPS